MAVPSIGNNEARVLNEEARRIAALLELARQESILDAQEMALSIEADGYNFQLFDGQEWQPLQDDAVLRPRKLPDDMELEVRVEGQLAEALKKVSTTVAADQPPAEDDAKAAAEKKKRQEEETRLARIFLLSSGEATPFEIVVRYVHKEGGYRIVGNALGEFSVAAMEGL
jgi:general secretion pathway protein H